MPYGAFLCECGTTLDYWHVCDIFQHTLDAPHTPVLALWDMTIWDKMGTGKLKEKEFLNSLFIFWLFMKSMYTFQGRIKLDESPVPVGLFWPLEQFRDELHEIAHVPRSCDCDWQIRWRWFVRKEQERVELRSCHRDWLAWLRPPLLASVRPHFFWLLPW